MWVLRLARATCSEGLQDATPSSCRVGPCVLAQLGFRVSFGQAAQNVLRLLLVIRVTAPGLHWQQHLIYRAHGESRNGKISMAAIHFGLYFELVKNMSNKACNERLTAQHILCHEEEKKDFTCFGQSTALLTCSKASVS